MENGKIGKRIKSYRENKDLSIEQLAERTGLDATFIAAIEAQTASPALGPLVKIARALGVRLGTFTDDALSDDPLIHRLADRKLDSEPLASGAKHPEMTYQHLGKGKADRCMEPFFIRLEPEGSEPEMSSHEGEEFIVVASGEVVLRYGQETHTLTPGDSMYYNSVVPHHVGSKGPGPAEIHAVLYVPF